MTSPPVDLDVSWRGIRLSGTLHLPVGDGPHPAVLMMQGSGPADRDADGYFVEVRQTFIERGFATYAFDKPGCGDSTGDWRDHGLFDRGDQALAVLAALRAHAAVDASAVGIWGQSQGGWLVQLVAGELHDLAFAISNSGPTIGVREQDLYGCEHTMRADGYADAEIASALTLIERLHEAAARGRSFDDVDRELIDPVRHERWAGAYMTLDDPAEWQLAQAFVREAYDPLRSLASVRCPFLAVYGGRDVLVPAWRSAREAGDALRAANHPGPAVVVFPTGDHRIRDATGGFVPGYLDLIGDWAAGRVADAVSRRGR